MELSVTEGFYYLPVTSKVRFGFRDASFEERIAGGLEARLILRLRQLSRGRKVEVS